MSGDAEVSIGARLAELRSGMDQAGKMVGKFRQDVSRSGENARTFAKMIGSIGLEAKGAAGMVSNLLGSFAAGGVMGLAIGGVNLLVGALREQNEETDKLNKTITDSPGRLAKAQEAAALLRIELSQGADAAAEYRAELEMLALMQEIGPAIAKVKADLATAERMLFGNEGPIRADEQAEWQARKAELLGQLATLEGEKTALLEKHGAEREQRERTRAEKAQREHATRLRESAKDELLAAEAHIWAWEEYERRKKEAMKRAHAPDTSGEASAGGFFDLEAGGYNPADAAKTAIRAQEEYNREVQRTASVYAAWGRVAASTIGGVLTGQMSAGEALVNLSRTVMQAIMDLLIQKAATALAAHLIERPVNIAEVTAAAGVAGAEGAAAVAGIPFFGPALAAGVAASLPGTIMAATLPLASAAGGLMVPSDMILKVHEDERVLPARYSEGLDDLVLGGGRRGGGLTVVVQGAADARDVRRTLRRNKSPLVQVLREIERDGRRRTR